MLNIFPSPLCLTYLKKKTAGSLTQKKFVIDDNLFIFIFCKPIKACRLTLTICSYGHIFVDVCHSTDILFHMRSSESSSTSSLNFMVVFYGVLYLSLHKMYLSVLDKMLQPEVVFTPALWRAFNPLLRCIWVQYAAGDSYWATGLWDAWKGWT